MKIALCQLQATPDAGENLRAAEDAIRKTEADLYVFPEMFLSSYDGDLPDGFQSAAMSRLQFLCRMRKAAVCMGLPIKDGGKEYNSDVFITPDQTFRYDKLHLARFGPYAETRFEQGNSLTMVEWKGMRIGMSVCYDIMFPEVHRAYGKAGADIVIASSASLPPSRPFMERIAPARSLENTVYTVYINNVGPSSNGTFFGHSSLYSPLGERIYEMDENPGIMVVEATREAIDEARSVRHHLQDMRRDMDWNIRTD